MSNTERKKKCKEAYRKSSCARKANFSTGPSSVCRTSLDLEVSLGAAHDTLGWRVRRLRYTDISMKSQGQHHVKLG